MLEDQLMELKIKNNAPLIRSELRLKLTEKVLETIAQKNVSNFRKVEIPQKSQKSAKTPTSAMSIVLAVHLKKQVQDEIKRIIRDDQSPDRKSAQSRKSLLSSSKKPEKEKSVEEQIRAIAEKYQMLVQVIMSQTALQDPQLIEQLTEQIENNPHMS